MFKTKFLDCYVATNAFISSVTTAHIVCSVFVKFQMTHMKFCPLHYCDFAHFVYPGVSFQNCKVCENLSMFLMKYTSNNTQPLLSFCMYTCIRS